MAGRKQHHVWQMLQRGFSDGSHREKDHVWVYRKDALPKQTNTRKYGVSDRFYGDEGSLADANITKFENRIQGLIHRVRKGNDGEQLDPDVVAPYLSHLEMRSLFMRSEASRMGEKIADFVKNEVASEEGMRKLVAAYLGKPDFVAKCVYESDLPAESHELALAYFNSEFVSFREKILEDISLPMNALVSDMSAHMVETVKSGHIRALEHDFTEVERNAAHAQLDYRVIRSDRRFILPDTCVAFFKRKGVGPLTTKEEHIEAVVAPVSTSAAILGLARGSYRRNDDVLIKSLASCSFQSFLFDRNCPDKVRLTKRIGKDARVYSEVEMSRALRLDHWLSSI